MCCHLSVVHITTLSLLKDVTTIQQTPNTTWIPKTTLLQSQHTLFYFTSLNWFHLPPTYTHLFPLYGLISTLTTTKSVYVGHLCFQSRAPKVTQVANKWKPLGTTKNWTLHHHLCKCTVQGVESGGLLGQLTHCQWTVTWSIVIGQLPQRAFQSFVRTCGDRMDDEWAQCSSTMNEHFGLCTTWRKK